MTAEELGGIWNYYLCLEQDLDNTSRFVEPRGQEKVYSFEFCKLLILSCTELETVFKLLCKEISGKNAGNMSDYKETLLTKYPKICEAKVLVPRLGRQIKPFSGWDNGKLEWWSAYTNIKHNRGEFFEDGSYKNVIYALSALYISIFYLSKETGIPFSNYKSTYLDSDYENVWMMGPPSDSLPDFENTSKTKLILPYIKLDY